MVIEESINSAYEAIRSNLLRSLLTALAIIIGTAAVISMIAIGSTAQNEIQKSMDSLGGKNVSVFAGQRKKRGVRSNWVPLTMDDAKALQKEREINWQVSPQMEDRKQVKFGDKNASLAINGTDGSYFTVEGLELEEGDLYTDTDSLNRNRVAVIGAEVTKELNLIENFDGSLLNKNISIGGTSFEVIGILKKKGSGGWNGPDERIFIPLLTASERVMGHERLQSIRVSVPDEVTISEAMIEIERVIRSEHDIGPGDDNDFRIIDWSEIREMQQETFAILTTMITGIASISLLVGGIGVMNIMLVSVTERTREIGLRKALGATPKTILVQFLIEAMMLCIIGGVMGVLIGSLIVISVAISQDWAFYIPISAIIGSITFSAFVGLLFGVWPARRAASLDPAVALQYE